MSALNGTLLRLYVDGVAVAAEVSHEISINHETRDVSNKDTGRWRARRSGFLDWSFSFEAMFDLNQAGGMSAIFALVKDEEPVDIDSEIDDALLTHDYSGPAYITELTRSGEHQGNATYSGSGEGAGELIEST
jgi:predicted secreted protein